MIDYRLDHIMTPGIGRRDVHHRLKDGSHAEGSHQRVHFAMAMSLVASTRGVALLPAYAKNFLPGSVISRPLTGDSPKVDLVIAYNTANTSSTLKLFLSRIDDLLSRRRIRPAGSSEQTR